MTISASFMYDKCREGVGYAAKHNPGAEYDDLPDEWRDASPTIKAAVNTATQIANSHAGEQYRLGRAEGRNQVISEIDSMRHRLENSS